MRSRLRVVLGLPLALGLMVLGACAGLPPRPTTATEQLALPIGTDTALDQAIAPLAAAHPGQTGFHLVLDGVEAFALRGLSARKAGRSIDVQYFIWHDDLTGRLLARELVDAADRGVRVRMLLDDLDARQNNFALAALDAHPMIDVRLFNPFASRKGGAVKMFEFLGNLERMNHRMHNKNWIVDNRIAIAGGRNIGDEYFAASEGLNFLDIDFAMVGPGVQQVSADFDRYWNSAAVWPVAALSPELVTDASLIELRGHTETLRADAAKSPWVQALVASQALERIPSGQAELRWTDRWQALSDDPMKALSEDDPLQRSAVLRGVVAATEQATTSVKFISPYFVSGPNGTPWLTGLVDSGREVLILTNTLAATDVAAVHGGYSKFRKKLLEGGVELWELKPDPTYKSPSSMFGSSGASLHTKGAIFDEHTVMIGSFNLDPRSVSLNCEQGIFVTDPVLAAQLEAQFQRMISGASAWKVELDAGGKLQWSDGKQVLRKEPEASFWRKAQAWLTRLLPFESQL